MDAVSKFAACRPATLVLLISLIFLTGCNASEWLPPDARLPDGSTYTGDIENGLFHGDGVQEFASGMIYRGQFRDGYWQGEGVLESPAGWRYAGEFEQGSMSGQGVLVEQGTRYEGEFAKDDFHGQGRFEIDGEVYLAQFKNGKPIEGRHITDYGTYQGEFKDWLYHGEGTFAFVDEYDGIGRLSGTWENGEFVDDSDEVDEEAASVEDVKEPEAPPRTEKILTEDRQRLKDQIDSLQAEQPGVADAYFLAVGGDGTESVFMRDIQVARAGLQQTFDLQKRAILLLNHRDYDALPLAIRPSIKTALSALDERMNAEEDLLVVHLVSHGGRDGKLLLQQPGIRLPNLSPQDFKEMLAPLKVQRKLLVVSACYSGQWIDEVKDENTWIMTSARKDRTSFGCGDDSEMTWFTKAVYQEVGLSLNDPDSMFAEVERQIRAWEEEIGMEEEQLSYPQMYVGEGIRQWLEKQQQMKE